MSSCQRRCCLGCEAERVWAGAGAYLDVLALFGADWSLCGCEEMLCCSCCSLCWCRGVRSCPSGPCDSDRLSGCCVDREPLLSVPRVPEYVARYGAAATSSPEDEPSAKAITISAMGELFVGAAAGLGIESARGAGGRSAGAAERMGDATDPDAEVRKLIAAGLAIRASLGMPEKLR